MELPSTKPYFLRALWEWCCDHGFTPFIVVQVDERTRVPREHVRDGQIILNVGQEATHRLKIGNELVEFQACFGGVARDLSIPVGQVVAIYARENGVGMAFEADGTGVDALAEEGAASPAITAEEDLSGQPSPVKPAAGRPGLKLVKS